MSESNHKPRSAARSGKVLDPQWEDELRRGQEAEGKAGSVDAELAYVHLLRHARAPESLETDKLDALWSEIDAELWPASTPWWRKTWIWWMAPAAAAAAVLFVVVVDPGQQDEASIARSEDRVEHADQAKPAPAPAAAEAEAEFEEGDASAADEPSAAKTKREARASGGTPAQAQAEETVSSPQLSALRANFVTLAPTGRKAIRVSVDQSRDQLRTELLDLGRRGG